MASIIGVETLQHTNGTTAATIDSSGRILQPANPKFSASLAVSSALVDYTSDTDVLFDTIDFNVGNCIALSSNAVTFTAPITGYYQFNLTVSLGSIDGSGYISTYLVIDDETPDNPTYRNIEDTQGGGFVTAFTGALIYLTANQRVNPIVNVNTDTTANIRPGTRFSGFLVG